MIAVETETFATGCAAQRASRNLGAIGCAEGGRPCALPLLRAVEPAPGVQLCALRCRCRVRTRVFEYDFELDMFCEMAVIGNNVFGEEGAIAMSTCTASVGVNWTRASCKDRYFRAQLAVGNTDHAVWPGVTKVELDASNYVARIQTGHAFVVNSPEAFTYDADGNMTSDGRWDYTWDAENRLVKAESRSDTPQASWRRVEWTYDALGRRIRQTTWSWLAQSNLWAVTEDLKFLSDPLLFGRQVVDLNASNNVPVRSYAWGLDLSETLEGAGGVGGLLWMTLHTGSGPGAGTHFCACDGNGNVVALASASDGSPIARYEYGPFGEPIRVTGPAAGQNPFRFSIKRTDSATDLVLYEYRAYSPTLGRWLSRDLFWEHTFTTFTLSWWLSNGVTPDRNEHGFNANDSISSVDVLGGGILCYCLVAWQAGHALANYDRFGKSTMDGGAMCHAGSVGTIATRTVSNQCLNRMFVPEWCFKCTKRSCLIAGEFVCTPLIGRVDKSGYLWVSTGRASVVKDCP